MNSALPLVDNAVPAAISTVPLLTGKCGSQSVPESTFNKPVLVRTARDTEEYRIGFITKDDLSELGMGNELVAYHTGLTTMPAKFTITVTP